MAVDCMEYELRQCKNLNGYGQGSGFSTSTIYSSVLSNASYVLDNVQIFSKNTLMLVYRYMAVPRELTDASRSCQCAPRPFPTLLGCPYQPRLKKLQIL